MGINLNAVRQEYAISFNRSQTTLEEVKDTIDEVVDDKSTENLEDLARFEVKYQALTAKWDTFHRNYNDWRKTGGGCNRTATLEALDQYSRRMDGLARQVRDLPQSGFLLPVHTLLSEAAEGEEGAMRALYNSWRPFTVDAFIAVDEERANAARLRRQADIGLQELRGRP